MGASSGVLLSASLQSDLPIGAEDPMRTEKSHRAVAMAERDARRGCEPFPFMWGGASLLPYRLASKDLQFAD